MSNNGGIESKEENKEKQLQPTIEMRIIAESGKPVVVHFPFLVDKIATYGFLKLAEKVLDEHYENQKQLIQPVKSNGILNFARQIFHK